MAHYPGTNIKIPEGTGSVVINVTPAAPSSSFDRFLTGALVLIMCLCAGGCALFMVVSRLTDSYSLPVSGTDSQNVYVQQNCIVNCNFSGSIDNSRTTTTTNTTTEVTNTVNCPSGQQGVLVNNVCILANVPNAQIASNNVPAPAAIATEAFVGTLPVQNESSGPPIFAIIGMIAVGVIIFFVFSTILSRR